MNKKRRIHDGIVGVIITLGILLGYFLNPLWLLVPGIIGIVLIQSAFSGFCPVYCALDKIMTEQS